MSTAATASPTSIASLLTTPTKDNRATSHNNNNSNMSDDLHSIGDKSGGSLYSTESEKDILNRSFVRTILDSASQRTLDGGPEKKGTGTNSNSNSNSAPRVSFSGVDSVSSETSLRDKTVDQLIEKVETLTLAKKQVQIDLSAEKAVRKKKERNLIKLAKELNKRAEEQKKHAVQTTQMDDKVAKLQEKVETTKKELEDITELQEKKSHEHHVEITALQDKFRQATKEHNDKTEDLRREILEANLTADKLRSKLARLEMVHAPDHADMIAERTMRDAMSTTTTATNEDVATLSPHKKKRQIVPLLMGMIAIVVGIMYNMDMLSRNAMCSPAMPGTTFSNTNASTEAPWWAPPPVKSSLFSVMCGEERVRTRMEYTHNPGNGQHKLTLWSVPTTTEEGGEGSSSPPQQQPTLLWEKRIGSQVTIFPEHLVITDKRGKTEEVQSGLPWTLS